MKPTHFILEHKPTSNMIAILAAIYIAVMLNRNFFAKTIAIYPLGDHTGFLISLLCVLVCLVLLMITIVGTIIPVRIVVSGYIIIASIASYYMNKYQTIFSDEMFANIVQTHASEAWDVISAGLLIHILVFGVIPVTALWLVKVRHTSGWRKLRYSAQTIVAAVIIMVTCVYIYAPNYSSFVRQHKAFRYYTNPAYPVYSLIKYSTEKLTHKDSGDLIKILPDAKITEKGEDRELIILVLGETARKDRFSLYGYERLTNPLLQQEDDLIIYENVVACGTSTAVSLPCIFSHFEKDDFDADESGGYENVLDRLSSLGVNILWLDNNSSSKGVADRVRYEDYSLPSVNPVCDVECRDIGMLSTLQNYIDSQAGDILIVLHQSGSHGPAYYKRYPKEFEKFTPACQSAELAECSKEAISNAYDNSILYTDYFLSEVIKLLKDNTPRFETAMLYVSDHGESLGDKGIYLHGLPYSIAPQEQVDIPVLLWTGASSDIDVGSALSRKEKKLSHDAIFYSLLEAFEVTEGVPEEGEKLFLVQDRYSEKDDDYKRIQPEQ
jgi:lipid A ethanolaminephosphotransferase